MPTLEIANGPLTEVVDYLAKYHLTALEICASSWMLPPSHGLREFVLACEDSGYHKSEKHTFFKEGKEQLKIGEEVWLQELPSNFKFFTWDSLTRQVPELLTQPAETQNLMSQFLGFKPWPVDEVASIIDSRRNTF
jgi:hypothetical protein